jgi:predicted enzyme related to lactoylglutathione lyase
MKSRVCHVAIHAGDPSRAQRFYQDVFGWKFEPFGPPGFLKTDDDGAGSGVIAAIQSRHELVPGKPIYGLECSIEVDDVDAVAKQVKASGGTIVMEKATIPTVGSLIKFLDTEGNLVVAIQFVR